MSSTCGPHVVRTLVGDTSSALCTKPTGFPVKVTISTVFAARVCDIAAAEIHDADAVRQQDVPTLGAKRPQDGVHPAPRRGE